MKLITRTFCKQTKLKPPVTSAQKTHKKLNVETNYRPVANINAVFNDIDTKLGINTPPSIEYLYVVPAISLSLIYLRRLYSSSNPYGHSAVRYTTSDGKQYIMNIVGKPGSRMVNFLDPTDYLFGDPSITCDLGSEQGGVFNRSIIGFRLENYPKSKIDDMHQYFIDLQERELKKKEVSFNLMGLPGWIRIPFLSKAYERGNCALWTSKGFVAADIFKQPTIFPKYIFVKLYMKSINSWGWNGMYTSYKQRCNIVSYEQVIDGEERNMPKPRGWTTPLLFTSSNRNFRNLKRFAHCTVMLERDVNDICYRAKVEKCVPWIPKFLNIWQD